LVRFVGPKLTRPEINFDQLRQDCLIVLNPYQGIGREYSKKLIDYLLSLAEMRPVYVRLHPSDDRDMFIRQMKNMKNVHLSQRTWAEDLGQYTHFALLNSTCVLDVLNADKNVATLMCNKLGYSKPAIASSELIPDLDTPQDFVRFVTDISKQSIKEKIMNETFLEFANSCQ
jgi:hypothetical protein